MTRQDPARMQPDGVPFADGSEAAAARQSRTRAFVKVQDGCNNRCTFCVVTLARGESRSRGLRSVVDEIQALVPIGVQEAVLTGVHLGSYGRDLAGNDATDLKQSGGCDLAAYRYCQAAFEQPGAVGTG